MAEHYIIFSPMTGEYLHELKPPGEGEGTTKWSDIDVAYRFDNFDRARALCFGELIPGCRVETRAGPVDKLEDLQARYDEAGEHLAEVTAEYKSEVALCGDAWPGAQIAIADIRIEVAKLHKEIVSHPDYQPDVTPRFADAGDGDPIVIEEDDIPF